LFYCARLGFTKEALAKPSEISTRRTRHQRALRFFESLRRGFAKASKEWEYRPAAPAPEPACLGLRRDGVALHVSSFSGDGVAGGVASFQVREVDALFAEFTSRGVLIELEPCDQSWGNREMYVRDADGNSLRFIQTKESALT